jgi:DNA polymerase-3 subunit delta
MEITLNSLETDAQNKQLAPVYLIQGTEQYLLDQVRQTFSAVIAPEDRTLNFAQFDMRETPLAVAIDDARSVPFFGDRRVVFIDDAYFLTAENPRTKIEHQVDELVKYVNQPEPQTILVIFAPYEKLDSRKKITKLLKEKSQYLSFSNLSESTVRQMVTDKVQKAGYQIDGSALQLLLRLTNMSLTQMMSEVDKLLLYTLDSKHITESAVSDLVSRTLSENIFDLIDALLTKKLTGAVNLYHELILSGEEPLRLHAAILGQFRLLLQVKTATLSEKGLADLLKVHSYRIKLARGTVRRFSYQALAKAYLGLVNMEEQLKSSGRDAELLFELFVLRYQAETK